ncbi:MAG: carbohydrate-binding domain-containing protein, partial [Clostridiales bacterium]|nr:carbohydrate-binding domain-containing protein [Clostridiales bacterium]
CDTDWVAYDEGETEEYTASETQDTSSAGANVIIADGSINTVTGSHVAKIYKDNDQSKKLYKFDAAFYSKMSMNVNGEEEGDGVLNIIADNEGLDSELHLTINGGKINIQSQDDGINTNEDGVSVTTINGGSLHIVAGLGSEGDGIDSNGYLVINGGTVIAIANPASDAGLDSDSGSYINGGYVVATGSTMDWADSDSAQVTMNLQFASAQSADEAIIVTTTDGTVIFAYDPDQDETTGSYNRSYQGAVISCPELQQGETYYVYVGGDVEGTDVDGLYDASTVTGFSGATRQIYTGSDVGMTGGMNMGSGMGNMSDMGEAPDNMGEMGEQGEQPEMPEETEGEMTIPEGAEDMSQPDMSEPGEQGEQPEMPEG